MDVELTKVQELKYKKLLVEARIIRCKHEINFEDFCLICKSQIT